jgi:EAL domain-containing protein (putative c-di-GMP-specific phosphodiesterase class I)
VLTELKDLGLRLSIDDFGTGYSSLAYLRRFPVDQLKVDRSFVQDVAEHGDTRIMQAVVRLAHDLGLEVVAEGVETKLELELELDTVQGLGCDVVQGYLFGRPVPPDCVDHARRPNELSPPIVTGAE